MLFRSAAKALAGRDAAERPQAEPTIAVPTKPCGACGASLSLCLEQQLCALSADTACCKACTHYCVVPPAPVAQDNTGIDWSLTHERCPKCGTSGLLGQTMALRHDNGQRHCPRCDTRLEACAPSAAAVAQEPDK